MKSHLKNLIQINGSISISQFMNEALFHPKLGYYQSQNPFGKDGDFITAPEISQVFGELIGAYLVGIWQNNYSGGKINLVEMGAGRGTLMKDLLGFACKISGFLDMVNISIIEISPRLQEVQQQNLQEFKIDWYGNFADFYKQKNDAPIFFVANELFDCFAIDQFVKTQNGWAERMVGISGDGELGFVLKDLINIKVGVANPDLQRVSKNEELNFNYHPDESRDPYDVKKWIPTFVGMTTDGIAEYSPQAINFMNELSQVIKKTNGLGLIIDYGYLENQRQQYSNGTLQAIKNHQYVNILQEAGNCDMTTLVNFSSLEKIAQKNNLQTSLITQKEFLTSLGIATRKEKLLAGKHIEQQKQINSAINRLIDKKQMGELFKVLVIW